MERRFKTPQVPTLPILTAVARGALMANLAVETWLRFLVWLVVEMAVYFFYGRTHAKLAPGTTRTSTPSSVRTRASEPNRPDRSPSVCTRWGRVLKMQLALSP